MAFVRFRWIAAALLVGLAVCCGARFAQAQTADGYQVMPFDEDAMRRQRGQIFKIINGSEKLDGHEEAFDDFFQRYIFAEMTRPEKRGELSQLRTDFLRRYLRAAKLPEARAAYDRLNQLTLRAMPIFIARNFHPAVRYNATLILGELDQEPAVEFGLNRQPPQPLPEALPVLLKAYQASSLPDVVKIGALLGIQRHLEHRGSTIPEAQRETIASEMFRLATAKNPPAGRSRDGHDWMRRRAIEALAMLGSPGGKSEVLAALARIVADSRESLAVRAQAADAVGRLNYDAAVEFDMGRLAGQLAQLAVDAASFEEATVTQAGQLPSRGRLAMRLTAVQRALDAAAKIATAAEQPLVKAAQKPVADALATLEEPGLADEMLAANLNGLIRQLQSGLPKQAAAPAPTDPTSDAASPDPFSLLNAPVENRAS